MLPRLRSFRAPLALFLGILFAGSMALATVHFHPDRGVPAHCHTCALAHAPAAESPAAATIAPPPARATVRVVLLPDTPRESHRLVASSRAPPTA